MKKILIVLGVTALFTACVSPRKFEDERARRVDCETKKEQLADANKALTEENNELKQAKEQLLKLNKKLVQDSINKGLQHKRLMQQYDAVNKLNDELLSKMKERNAMNDAETRKLLSELQKLQENLQKREDALKLSTASLAEEQKRLDELNKALQSKEGLLEAKNKRVAELESAIAAKDSALSHFKEKLSSALLGFEGDGLTIDQRDGKVYVSLEEKLLFKSGKWSVDPKGQKALAKLTKVLVDNPDINIMIEGHTDNVPYKGRSGITDNWDLSVKRSTSIVKILLNNKGLDPKRIIAAGRGEFLPIDNTDTKEGRAKNRRTEIILTPNWDEIFNVLKE